MPPKRVVVVVVWSGIERIGGQRRGAPRTERLLSDVAAGGEKDPRRL